MKRSTASWTTAFATVALLAMPIASQAQQSTPSKPSPSTSQPASADAQKSGAAQEHLRKAKAALDEVPAASWTGTAKTRVAELKRHLSTLEQSAARGKGNWSTDVAAADRIVNELLGATPPAAAGTTGSAASNKSTKQPATPAPIDDAARAKLEEVRTHLTAFAAAMSGTAPTPSSDDPSASASAAAPAAAAAAPRDPAAAAPTPAEPAAAAPQPAPSAQQPQPPTSPTPAAPSPSSPSSPGAAAAPQQSDTEAVRRHLTAARDSLSQLTQLPAASQLTGDARTQVAQLITNFNELITTNTDWRASYTKVQANLTALIGDQKTDESAAAPAAGQAGAVGTTGTVTLDPAIRAKLVEFRTHLMDFEKAAGGASPSSAPAPEAQPAAQPSEPAAAAAPTTPSPTPTAEPTPSPTSTAGSTANTPAAAGTTGNRAPASTDAEQQQPASQPAQRASSHPELMRHIEAIEKILNGTSAAGTTGSTAKAPSAAAGSPTLTAAQIEQIKTHLADLRRAIESSK